MRYTEPKIVTEAKDCIRYEKAPILMQTPTLEGYLQVRYAGTKCTRGNVLISELQLMLVDRPELFSNILYNFGNKLVKKNTIVSLDTCHFDVEIGGKIYKSYFQTFISGNIKNIAEICIRFSDRPSAGGKVLIDCGTKEVVAGGVLTINNTKFKINLKHKEIQT